jgi:predicted phage baseplate assembly protein
MLGSSTGDPGQQFRLRAGSVLPGEDIEILELQGSRAQAEWEILRDELLKPSSGGGELIPPVPDSSGNVTEVWVRWRAREDFSGSGPSDRDYVIERNKGVIKFGDDRQGRIPPAGSNNVKAKSYRTGGGAAGNVAAMAITQLLSPVSGCQDAFNPLPAAGGGDGESIDLGLNSIAMNMSPQNPAFAPDPRASRHLGRAITSEDYESLALEASAEVAAARVMSGRLATGEPRPGGVTVVILPKTTAPNPVPSEELCTRVRDYLNARTPAARAGVLEVVGPKFFKVGADITVLPLNLNDAGPTQDLVTARVQTFLHPVVGGPDGQGWEFGRDVFASDLASIIEHVPGVAALVRVEFLVDEVPAGDRVSVPAGYVVAAGPVRVHSVGSGGT